MLSFKHLLMTLHTGYPLNNVMYDLKMNDEGRISMMYITYVRINPNSVSISNHDDCIIWILLMILLSGDGILFDRQSWCIWMVLQEAWSQTTQSSHQSTLSDRWWCHRVTVKRLLYLPREEIRYVRYVWILLENEMIVYCVYKYLTIAVVSFDGMVCKL